MSFWQVHHLEPCQIVWPLSFIGYRVFTGLAELLVAARAVFIVLILMRLVLAWSPVKQIKVGCCVARAHFSWATHRRNEKSGAQLISFKIRHSHVPMIVRQRPHYTADVFLRQGYLQNHTDWAKLHVKQDWAIPDNTHWVIKLQKLLSMNHFQLCTHIQLELSQPYIKTCKTS